MEKSEIEMPEANDTTHNVAEISEVDQQLCGKIVISMEEMMKQLPAINRESSIYRVPKQLSEMNPKAYAPQLISIGPFHHGCQKDFRATEQYKLRALINFLRRINNDKKEYSLEEEIVKVISLEDLPKNGSLKVLVEKAYCWVKESRNCYAEPVNMKEEEFVIMMLLDACFIVEIFILDYDKYHPDCKFFQIQDNVDISFYQGIIFHIFVDLMKLENQVPFFLLQHLFDLIPKDSIPKTPVAISFVQLTHMALNFGFIGKYDMGLYEEPKHLVDFFSFFFAPFPSDMQNKQHEKNSEKKNNNNFLSFICLHLCGLWNKKPHRKNDEEDRLIPPSVTELCEAGVTIKIAENAKYLINISFKNGVLEIPPLYIYDETELLLRNVVAFEDFPIGNKNKYAIQYVSFMDDLISTEKDVSLLVKAGVIINSIGGSDKEVSDLFNNLCRFVAVPLPSDHFDNISKALREHCNGRWNKAKASLKHNYFNTPWAIISFFAATFLILLTLLQTIFSAISTFPT